VARRRLGGTPSDLLPDVLAAGSTDVTTIFVSMSARQPEGRDEEYLEWHSLDHRPEQHRIAGLRQSLRLVSTPACRSHRTCSTSRYDAVDHVMTYFFTGHEALGTFQALSDALPAERRPLTLPSVEYGIYDLAGKAAAPEAVSGADVLPWRPALGVFLLLEEGAVSPGALVGIDGVAGAWWHRGAVVDDPIAVDRRGLQLTYFFLDDDPVEVADRFSAPLAARWAARDAVPLFAAPLYAVVPFAWDRHLP
jgi:hypothetical protein